jgi:hypothetical protein
VKPLDSIVVATNRPWTWGRLGRQYSVLTQEHVDLELVVVADEFDQGGGWSMDLTQSMVPNSGLVFRTVPKGTLVGEKFRTGAEWARGNFVAFRSDDSIWHPRQFDWLYEGLMERSHQKGGTAYAGYGHGWFWAPRKSDLLHFMRPDLALLGTSLITTAGARLTSWARGDKVREMASDSHFMDNLRVKYGEAKPLDERVVYGLWLNHSHNMWDRSRLNYKVPLAEISDRVTEDRATWDRLVEDARATFTEHQCADCRW